MEKVRVSADIAKMADGIKKEKNFRGLRARSFFKYYGDSYLFDLSLDELSKILAFGYEVEPEFKVGDWVTWEAFDGKLVGRVLLIDEFDKVMKTDIRNGKGVKQQFSFGHSELKHATPSEIAEEKERRFFVRHGREPWELKTKDILTDRAYGKLAHVTHVSDLNTFINGQPQQHGSVKDLYRVACFAEDRLDGDSDE